MKQSDDPKAFFNKYGFTSTMTMKHPTFNDEMKFEGLESEYVGRLQQRIRELEKYIGIQNDKIDFLMTKDIFKWRRDANRDALEEEK